MAMINLSAGEWTKINEWARGYGNGWRNCVRKGSVRANIPADEAFSPRHWDVDHPEYDAFVSGWYAAQCDHEMGFPYGSTGNPYTAKAEQKV